MARFLAYTSPARGHLYPITPTLLELTGRGHDVHVRTLASEVAGLVEMGLRADAVAPAIEALPIDDWRSDDPLEGVARIFDIFAKRATSEIDDLRAAIGAIAPDCLIVDITTSGAAAVAEASGLPWARWIPFLAHATFGPEPPSRVDFIPYSIAPAGLDVVNGARAAVGLRSLGTPDDGWRASVELYLTAEPFEAPGLVYPDTFSLVGPGVWEPPSATPAWLDRVDEPLVLVTASSEYQLDDSLIRTALEALGSSDLEVVVSTAAHDPAMFTAPDNTRIERWLPHQPVIDRAACVVCHGGMGITQKALAAGVPVCIVPFGRDQFEVAKLVEMAGCGTTVMPDKLGPASLATAVREAMGMRRSAESIADSFRRAGGAPAAADRVEALLGARVAT